MQLKCKSQSPNPQPSILSCSHALGHNPPVLITERPGTRQLGMAPMPQSLLELFSQANPKSVYPAFQSPSHGNQEKGNFPCLPPTLHLLAHSGASQVALQGMPFSSEKCNKLSFKRLPSPDLLASQPK